MRYTLEYPSELPTAPDDFLVPDVIRDVVMSAEARGSPRSRCPSILRRL